MENDNVNNIKKLLPKKDNLSIGLVYLRNFKLKWRPAGLIFKNLTFFYDYQRSKISIWIFLFVIMNLRNKL